MNFDKRVQVILRVRPANNENLPSSSSVLQVLDQVSVSLDNKIYKFDSVSNDLSIDLSEKILKVEEFDVSKGSRHLILTYGQSQSGKTTSFFGKDESYGLVQMILMKIFQDLQGKTLKVSFFEIFQETVYDLLDYQEKSHDFDEEVSEAQVSTWPEAESLISKAKRRTGGKAHSIFSIKIGSFKIVFADLAGVERNTSGCFNGERIKENTFINKSLASLSNVFKAISHNTFINFKENKLAWMLKDSLETSRITLLAFVVPARKSYWENLNTLKFAARVSKIKGIENSVDLIESLKQEIFSLRKELENFHELNGKFLDLSQEFQLVNEKFKCLNEKNIDLLDFVEGLEERNKQLTDRNLTLEEENSILRKEVLEMGKIDTSDWLLSSDSEDNEGVFILNKEKNELENSLAAANEKISALNKELQCLNEKLVESMKEKEKFLEIISSLQEEIEEMKVKIFGYQELSVMLSKQNYDLINDLSKSKEICNEYFNDISIMSSTHSTKYEVNRIIEEKEAKLASILESNKMTEDSIERLKEKYSSDIRRYKKENSRLKQELATCKKENIRENEEAMKILYQLKLDKNKLMKIVELFSENKLCCLLPLMLCILNHINLYFQNRAQDESDKKKIVELKKINQVLVDGLKDKGEKVAALENQFKEFLKENNKLCEKFNRKKIKLMNCRMEVLDIKNYVARFKMFRNRPESSSLLECIKELMPVSCREKSKSGSSLQISKLNFSHC